jgi:hypothetical protein
VQKSVAELQGRENTLRAQEMTLRKQLDEPESRRLLDDAQFVNALQTILSRRIDPVEPAVVTVG